MVRLPTLNVNWSRDRVYVIRRGVVACCILFCLIGAGVETAAAQRSWPSRHRNRRRNRSGERAHGRYPQAGSR